MPDGKRLGLFRMIHPRFRIPSILLDLIYLILDVMLDRQLLCEVLHPHLFLARPYI
ncbi:MAG: hypothetical protein HN580_30225 [Deltaproteobacteria bacterium]|nr:hypothetical protein [Deltaproteobacteria bacterium]